MSYSILNKYQIHPIYLEIEQVLNDELNIILELAVKDNSKNILESDKENDIEYFIEQYLSPVLEFGRYNVLSDRFKIVSLPMFEIITLLNDSKKSKVINENLEKLINLSLGENLIPPFKRYRTIKECKEILEEYKYKNIFPNIKELITFVVDFNNFSESLDIKSSPIGDFLKNKPKMKENNFKYFAEAVNRYIYKYQNRIKEIPDSLVEVSLLLTSMILFSNKIIKEDVEINELKNDKIANYANQCIMLIDEHLNDHNNRIRMIWEEILNKLKK